MRDKYRIVIIGCGSRAHAHADACRMMPEVELVACCALHPERREAFASKYGLRGYADAAAMIRAEHPDMVHIVTWPDTHLFLMETVSELEVPLCTLEKPLATGVRDWMRMTELERESTTRFAVCHQFRWHRDLARVRSHLADAGPVRLVHMSCGMNISGQGTHILDYGMSLNGDSPVTEVFGQATGWDREDAGHPAPLGSEAILRFENGATGVWTTGTLSPRVGDLNTTWQHVRVEAFAQDGRGLYGEFGDWCADNPSGRIAGCFPGMDGWQAENVLAQVSFHRAMLEWHKGGKACGTNLAQSLHEWKVVLALYQSALSREPIRLADFHPAENLPEQLRNVLNG